MIIVYIGYDLFSFGQTRIGTNDIWSYYLVPFSTTLSVFFEYVEHHSGQNLQLFRQKLQLYNEHLESTFRPLCNGNIMELNQYREWVLLLRQLGLSREEKTSFQRIWIYGEFCAFCVRVLFARSSELQQKQKSNNNNFSLKYSYFLLASLERIAKALWQTIDMKLKMNIYA